MILQYCEYYKIHSLLVEGTVLTSQDPQSDLVPLFESKSLERAVSDEFRHDIFNHLIHKLRKAQYVDAKKPEAGVLIYWRSLAEWAKALHDYVEKTGQLGTILTVYELTSLEDPLMHDDLRNIDYNLFVKVLDVLIKQGKAQVLMSDDGSGQIGGVKIV